MKSLFTLATMILIMTGWTGAPAHAWAPSKNIEIVVPYPPGGATDKLGRVIGEIFNKHGWNSVVTNRPGADTVIASNYVAGATADGHTLYLGSNGFIDANLVYNAPGIRYTQDSFSPVVPLGVGSFVLVANNGVPVTNYNEFKEYVKKNPSKFTLGFWNTYTSKIFYEWAKREGLPEPTIVIYKGSAPLMVDVMGGHVNFAVDTVTSVRQHYLGTKIKVLATLDPEGIKLIRNLNPQAQIIDISARVPSAGVNLYYGLFAPQGLDANIAKQIQDLVNSAFADPNLPYRNLLLDYSIVNPGGTAAVLKQRQIYLYNQFLKSADR
jgi:tripartite-type tricarboxylate transporter receptor subunit TctC